MPELPEVETIGRQLSPDLIGRVIESAGGHESAKFADAPLAIGARILGVRRRAKYLIVGLDGDRDLVIHLGMTGQLSLATVPPDDHVRAWWRFDDGSLLVLRDTRRFGRVAVVPAGDFATLPTLAAAGPEPLDGSFDLATFARALNRSNRHIKTMLLGQRVVAGVGNIYADEALWRARINPATRRVSARRARRLHTALRWVLSRAIARDGTTLRDYRTASGQEGRNQDHLHCYGRDGEPCDRCATVLRRRVIDGRGTTWCPRCQRR